MVRVAGRPVLEHVIEWLRKFGIEEIMVNLFHLPDQICGYFGDGSRWRVRLFYSQEERLLGTAGGVRRVAWFFKEPFLLWYGDNLSTCRLDRLWELHRAKGAWATIALHHRDDPTQSGIAELDGDGRIVRFLEKPKREEVFSHWVNAGIVALQPEVLEGIPTEGTPDFGRDVFPALLKAGKPVYGYCMSRHERLVWLDTLTRIRRILAAGKRLGGPSCAALGLVVVL